MDKIKTFEQQTKKWKITIKAKSGSVGGTDDLSKLDGIDCQDNFSEYFDDDSYTDVVSGGYMRFKYENGELYTITTYSSTRELTPDELHDLGEYTQGQWSDGIGEGFEQSPCDEIDGEEIYISPWYGGQKLTITQD